jgi:hypothetical protein
MISAQRPVAATVLLLGVLVTIAGSFADDLLGSTATVTLLQTALWIAGGILMLAGATSVATLRLGGKDRVAAQRRTQNRLRATTR